MSSHTLERRTASSPQRLALGLVVAIPPACGPGLNPDPGDDPLDPVSDSSTDGDGSGGLSASGGEEPEASSDSTGEPSFTCEDQQAEPDKPCTRCLIHVDKSVLIENAGAGGDFEMHCCDVRAKCQADETPEGCNEALECADKGGGGIFVCGQSHSPHTSPASSAEL